MSRWTRSERGPASRGPVEDIAFFQPVHDVCNACVRNRWKNRVAKRPYGEYVDATANILEVLKACLVNECILSLYDKNQTRVSRRILMKTGRSPFLPRMIIPRKCIRYQRSLAFSNRIWCSEQVASVQIQAPQSGPIEIALMALARSGRRRLRALIVWRPIS